MSDSEFACTFEEFKKISCKFLDRLKDPNISDEMADGAKSAWFFHYKDCNAQPHEAIQLPILFGLVMREWLAYRICA